jgi:hypothetical protein
MTTGARFAKWGLGLFIFGVFLTFQHGAALTQCNTGNAVA